MEAIAIAAPIVIVLLGFAVAAGMIVAMTMWLIDDENDE